jgi:aminoglycoside 3-N-acetyltransferase
MTVPSTEQVTQAQLVEQLETLGVETGGVLLVHTSFRAVMPVEGGPAGLIAALRRALGSQGTLVMPTMTDGESVYDPCSTPSVDMGVTAETFWRQAGVVRSSHPGASFAAAGPRAREICAPQPLTPPHGPESPPGRVHALGGQVLLLGVQHSESTILHVAEAIAGVPYAVSHPCVVVVDGVPEELLIDETDHCCRGFGAVDGWLDAAGLQGHGSVGHAAARLFRATDAVRLAVEALRRDPLVFLCPPSTGAGAAGCEECDLARASIGATPRAGRRPLPSHWC